MDDRDDYEPPPFIQQPPRRVLYRVTLAVCAVAAILESALWVAGAGGFQDVDVFRLPFLCSPYLFLALYVWLQRRRTAASGVLLGAAVVMAAFGLAFAGAHFYRSLASGAPSKYDDVGLVACFQWLMVIVFGVLSVVVSAIAGANQDRFGPGPRRRRAAREED